MPYFYTLNASRVGIPYKVEPIITSQDVDANLAKRRDTVAECYALALEDLNFAEQNALTKAQRVGINKIVKVSKGAAISLKIITFQNI